MLAISASVQAQSSTIDHGMTVTVPEGSVNPWNVNNVTIGKEATGTLKINAGGTVNSKNALLGDELTAKGTAYVTGNSAIWNGATDSTGSFVVGKTGSGEIEITAGGVLNTNGAAVLGMDTSGKGSVLVSGSGSKWTAGKGITVGKDGSGTVTVEDGAKLTSASGSIGNLGKVVVSGYLSSWEQTDSGNSITIGSGWVGQGEMVIAAGAKVSGVGRGSMAGNAKVTIDGAGSSWLVGTGSMQEFVVGETSNGTARIAITNGGKLTSGITYLANRNGSQAEVAVDGSGSLWENDHLEIGQEASGTLLISGGAAVTTSSMSMVGNADSGTAGSGWVQISGAGSHWDVGSMLMVNSGHVRVVGGGVLNTESGASVGVYQRSAMIEVNGSGSYWNANNSIISVGTSGKGAVNLVNGGSIRDANHVVLGLYEGAPLSGTLGQLNIGGDPAGAASVAGAMQARRITIGRGGELNFNHLNSGYVIDSILAGKGEIHAYSGETILTGNGSAFEGTTAVNGGSLFVDGSLGGTVNVGAGGTLGGSGVLSGVVTVDGKLRVGNRTGTLTTGDLKLNTGSTTYFDLNEPNVAGGSINDYVKVLGDLTLGGTLEATIGAAGYYYLFNYQNALLNNTFDTVNVASNSGFPITGTLITDIANQVNLSVLAPSQTMQFWDGANTAPNDVADGGSGTWDAFTTNWTGQPGSANVNEAWGGSVGVFAGTAGTVTLSGAQRFDTLQFSTDGYVLQGDALEIYPTFGAGTLNIDSGVTTTIQSSITDYSGNSGVFRKTGGGTLILDGVNTYSGGTIIDGGVLSVTQDAALGAASGGLTLDGGILRVTGASFTQTSRNIALGSHGGGFDIANAGTTFTVDQALTGSGGLNKWGAGTLKLTGASTYSGGTTINAGTLIGDLVSLQGDITNNASLVFDQATNGTFAGHLFGNGALYKQGAGVLTLTSGGDFTGTFNVGAGTLVGDTRIFRNDIINNGAVVFHQTADGAYSAALSGAGAVTKSGAGVLILNGNSSAFSGQTTVTGGGLVIGDATHTGASLGGPVTVSGGTWLGGTGRIGGDLLVSGLLAPSKANADGSMATLTVGGDVTFASGSTYQVQADTAGNSDLLAIGGQLVIGDSNVVSLARNGTWGPQTEYTIITADGGVSGQFAGVTANLVFLTPILGYRSNAVTLTLERNRIQFEEVGDTDNQKDVADAVEDLGESSPIYGEIVHLPDEESVRDAFDQLSGEMHVSTRSALLDDSRFLRDGIMRRLNDSVSTMPAQAGFSVWADAGNRQRRGDAARNSAEVRIHDYGLSVGADMALGEYMRLGAAIGANNVVQKIDDRGSSRTEAKGKHAGFYWSADWITWLFKVGVTYTDYDVETTRNVNIGNLNNYLRGDYGAEAISGFLEGAYRFEWNRSTLEPYVAVAHTQLKTDAVREKGGDAALRIDSATDSVMVGTLGARAYWDLSRAHDDWISIFAGAAWEHVWGDWEQVGKSRFAGGNASFSVLGLPMDRNSAVIDAGVNMNLFDNSRLSLGVRGRTGDKYADYSVQLNWRTDF
jgi:T5SS/PEP-CTERM-associated repeat protein/autotransporter-associated beta strand protein